MSELILELAEPEKPELHPDGLAERALPSGLCICPHGGDTLGCVYATDGILSSDLRLVEVKAALQYHSPFARNGTAGRVFTAHRGRDGTKFWIIGEPGRTATLVLLPTEY